MARWVLHQGSEAAEMAAFTASVALLPATGKHAAMAARVATMLRWRHNCFRVHIKQEFIIHRIHKHDLCARHAALRRRCANNGLVLAGIGSDEQCGIHRFQCCQ